MLLLLLPLSVLALLSTILLSFCAPLHLICPSLLPHFSGARLPSPSLSGLRRFLAPSLPSLARLTRYLHQSPIVRRTWTNCASRPYTMPDTSRGRHNRQHYVGRDRFCNGVLLHPTNRSATVICKAQRTRATETWQTYGELHIFVIVTVLRERSA